MTKQTRLYVVIARGLLALTGLWVIVRPERPGTVSAASYRGQIHGKAAGALALLIAAVPWAKPPADDDAGEAAEAL